MEDRTLEGRKHTGHAPDVKRKSRHFAVRRGALGLCIHQQQGN